MPTSYETESNKPWSERLRLWLFDPIETLGEPTHRRAQLLAFLLLSLMALAIPIALISRYLIPHESTFTEIIPQFLPFVFGGLFVSYLISRTRHQNLAIWGAIVTSTIPIYAGATPIAGQADVELFAFLVVPILVARIFLSTGTTVLLSAANLVAIASIPLFNDTILASEVVEPLSLVGLVTMLIVASKVFVERSQIDAVTDVHEDEQRLSQLLELSPYMIAIQGDGKLLDVNPAGLRLLGASSVDDIVGQPADTFTPSREGSSESARLIRLRGEKDFALRTTGQFVRVDGRRVDVEITSIPIMYQGRMAMQIIARDVTNHLIINRALQNTEEHLKTIVELMSDYTYELAIEPDGSYRLCSINGAFEDLTGYKRDEFSNLDSWLDIIQPDDRIELRRHWDAVARGEARIRECRLTTRSGETRWIRDYGCPQWNDDRTRVTGIIAISQDITEQYQAEDVLKAHTLQQAVVAELGRQALRHGSDSGTMLELALTLTANVLNAEYCKLLELAPDGDTLVSNMMVGEDGRDTDHLVYDARKPTSQAGFTLMQGQPVIVDYLPSETRFKPSRFLQERRIISGASVIIHGRERPLGVLEVHTKHRRTFTVDDTNFMQSIGNVLAAYMEHEEARAAEQEQRVLAEALRDLAAALNSTLELDEVLDRTLAHLASVVPHDAASIMIAEQDVMRIVRHAGFDSYGTSDESLRAIRLDVAENRIHQQMVETGMPVVIDDVRDAPQWKHIEGTEWIRAHMSVPIFSDEQVVGVINADSATPGMFTEAHAQRLLAFANQVSMAIRNARHTAELEERVKARTAELEVERRRLQTILNSTGEGIFYSEGLVIQYANDALFDITGYTSGELAGRSIAVLLGHEPTQEELAKWASVQKVLRRGQIWRGEVTLYRKDGRAFEAGVTISLAGVVDDVVHTVTVMRDISQEKRLESQKSRFIANASHELRTPISSLNTRLYMMRRDPEHIDRHMVLMERVVERMSKLVEDLLDVSRFEHGAITLRKRDVILQNLIVDVLEVQQAEANRKHIQVDYHFPPEPLRVYVDPDRILQVLTNLLANAIHYTPEDGHVSVELASEQNSKAYAVVSITDDGMGISQDDLPHIFQPFFRADKEAGGTGLGLSIAREIVTQHGGEITVESELERGSTFRVRLPLLPPLS